MANKRVLGIVPEDGHCVLCCKQTEEARIDMRLGLYVCAGCALTKPISLDVAMRLVREFRSNDRELLSAVARASAMAAEWWATRLNAKVQLSTIETRRVFSTAPGLMALDVNPSDDPDDDRRERD